MPKSKNSATGSASLPGGEGPVLSQLQASITRRTMLRASLATMGGIALLRGALFPWPAVASTLADQGAWTERKPTNSPPRRSYAAMAYDESTNRILLFGGIGPGADTWTWNGSDWTFETPARSPSERFGASMAFDGQTGAIVLFGGQNERGALDDTWLWNGAEWNKRSFVVHPSGRIGASIATTAAGTILLFGGFDGTQSLGDTWVWQNGVWELQSASGGPPARYGAGLAYDPTLRKVVLLGGQASPMGVAAPTDIWAWDASGWSRLSSASSPSPRLSPGVAGDRRSGPVAVFGGLSDGRWRNDTWTFQNRWSKSMTSILPAPRAYSGLAQYGKGTLLLFGGQGAKGLLADTWTFQL